MLTKTHSQSLTGQLVERFAARIRDRLLAPGTRLPSIRECARQQGVSPHTVVAAYDRLLAQGLVQSRKNRGFFVREAPGRVFADNVMAPVGPSHATALIRAMFHGVSAKPQPGMGVFPPEWLAAEFMSAALRKVVRSGALQDFSLQYGEPAGDAGLRHALARRLNAMNISCTAGQIVTTVGATHALDVVSRTLLRAGDPVMVEEPGWTVEFARLEALGMRILPVPRGPNGPDLDVMAHYCETHAPKMFVSVSVLHNPTGHSLSPGSAHRMLQLAHRYGFYVVEDDTYCHIAPEHATRVCALDGLRRTIYVSGFAKILAPNWRVGFFAAPQELVERLIDTKLLSTLTTPALMEKAIAICIEQGQMRRHAERIRTRLEAARARSVRLALAAGCRFEAEPRGLFGWVDTGVDTDALAQRMLDEGYLLAPGALFHATRAASTLMRINFATTQDAAFWGAFARQRRLGGGSHRCFQMRGPAGSSLPDKIQSSCPPLFVVH